MSKETALHYLWEQSAKENYRPQPSFTCAKEFTPAFAKMPFKTIDIVPPRSTPVFVKHEFNWDGTVYVYGGNGKS